MNIFKNDLFRSFAVGFALGAVAICVVLGTRGGEPNPMVPAAVAAPTR